MRKERKIMKKTNRNRKTMIHLSYISLNMQTNKYTTSIYFVHFLSVFLSLSLSHTHTHAHTQHPSLSFSLCLSCPLYISLCLCLFVFLCIFLFHSACGICNANMATRFLFSHCNTLQRTSTHRNTLQFSCDMARRFLCSHCNTLQHTATHCNTPQHTAISI